MLELVHISKRYQYQKTLDDISIKFPESGIVAIVGPSGCGKSTLLHIIGGIDQDFQGEILWNQKHVKKHLTSYRKKHVSFIFQQFHLIMWLSVKQNVALPQFFHPQEKQKISLDMEEFQKTKMSSLSLGQRQRIAYLRSRYHHSDILLCDEPTGSLDPQHAKEVMELLKEESQQRLVILVSHDMNLVKAYSDEIYEMKDGQIVDHQICHDVSLRSKVQQRQKKVFFPHLQLSFYSFMSHKSRSLQLVFGFMISLLCIVLTLTMSRNLEDQINQYIYSLIPPSSISFQAKNRQSLSLSLMNQFEELPSVVKSEMYLDEFECLGIGFVGERYQESQTVFIGDDTSPYQDLKLHLGDYPKEIYEVMVSLSTAQHLCQDEDVSSLIGKKIYAWYQHGLEVKSIAYKVVGITNQTTALDTLYQQNHAYIHLLKDVYHFDETNVKATLGILYVQKDRDRKEVVKELKEKFLDYEFIEVGASTTQNISQTMEQVRIVLLIFSALAILSSLFLIGEVMFLNVVQKKKDLAIMKCFGASTFDILRIVLYESLEIVFLAQVLCSVLYYQLIQGLNMLTSEMLLNDQLVFSFDYQLLGIVYGVSYLLVLMSQIPPLFYVLKLNTIDALKN